MSKGSVLLVEDHRDLAETIIAALEHSEYIVDYAADGLQAIQIATNNVFDVIILDIMLPGLDGYSVCKQLRQEFGIDVPVLMLTARDTLDDKLDGFEHGADDYLVKPFDLAELLARVRALVNRRRGKTGTQVISHGDLTVDTRSRKLTRSGVEIELSPTGFEILRILLRESPGVVTREALEHELWGDDPPDSDALRSHIYLLRKSVDKPFKETSEPLIKTVKGVGLKIDEPD